MNDGTKDRETRARDVQAKLREVLRGGHDPDPLKALKALKALNNNFVDAFTEREQMAIALYRIQQAAKIPKGPDDQAGFTALMEVIASIPEVNMDPKLLKNPLGPRLTRF